MAGRTRGGTVDEPVAGHDDVDEADDMATDLLVEEVSIDGLCGVY
jgi:mycofactocin precursor